MKFQTRKNKRIVNEKIAGLLLPLKPFVDKATFSCILIALAILQETEVEDEESEGKE